MSLSLFACGVTPTGEGEEWPEVWPQEEDAGAQAAGGGSAGGGEAAGGGGEAMGGGEASGGGTAAEGIEDAGVEALADGGTALPPVKPLASNVKVTKVATVAALQAALAAATPGSVVEVTANLDLTGKTLLTIPAQVTLSGGGGVNGVGGVVLQTKTMDTPALFVAGGAGVRVTGVRLIGPDPDIGATPYGNPLSRAVRMIRANGSRVDHSELSGWSHAATYLDYSRNIRVDWNSIHHNRRTGLGYGTVLVSQSDAVIEHNVYDANRHAIAGTGRLGMSYVARHNRVGATRNGHAFDMHGQDEANDDGTPWAGDRMDIQQNTFLGTAQGIVIRGRPSVGAYISGNCFGQSQAAGTAIIQRYFTGNLFIGSNSYGQASGSCHVSTSPSGATRGDVNGDQLADVVLLANGSAYPYLGTPSGRLLPAPPSFDGTLRSGLFGQPGHLAIDVADVDGDLLADLVTAFNDGSVYVYRGQPGGTFTSGVASFKGTYPVSLTDAAGWEPIAVADVNGDGRDDLVSARNGTVFVHPGSAAGTFGSSAASFNGTFDSARFDGVGHFALDVADVTGDGRADLVTLHSSGTGYVYPGKADGTFAGGVESFAGTMANALIDGTGFEPVGLGDVNGDGRADLVTLNTDGTAYVYPGTATGKFASRVASFAGTMPTSLFDGTGFEAVAALDVTGDGLADLVTIHPSGVVYVYPGTKTGAFGGGVPSLSGIRTTRKGDRSFEPVQEKSLRRRLACTTTGCAPL